MPGATPLPNQGDVFFDSGRSDRSLRVSRHPDAGVVVLSIWNGGVCQGTFRLHAEQVELFADALLHPPAPPTTVSPAVHTGRGHTPAPPSMYVTGQYEQPAPTIP